MPFLAVLRHLASPVLTLLLLLGAVASSAQEGHYFALQGEGSAAAFVDPSERVAYVTDGGVAGARGIAGATMEGKPVLQSLIDRGVRRLVIACSHPHRDHMAGLVDLVTRDERILRFEEIAFVDNIAARGTGAKSLHEMYRERWQGVASAPRSTYSSAEGRNAFEGLSPDSGSLRVSNFVYEPDSIGATAHDRTIITEYRMGGREPFYVIDFDDASSRLIRAWSEQRPAPRAHVVVMPHHGSRHNDLGQILTDPERFGLRVVVIPVNRSNRYFHPSPSVLLQALEAVGADHVFLTDSEVGNNVVVTPLGVRRADGATPNRRQLQAFLRSQIERHEARRRHLVQQANSRAARVAVLLDSSSAPPPRMLEQLRTSSALTERQVRDLERTYGAIEELSRAAALVATDEGGRREILAPLTDGEGPRMVPTQPEVEAPKPGAEGVRAYRERLRELNQEPFRVSGPEASAASGGSGPRPSPRSGPHGEPGRTDTSRAGPPRPLGPRVSGQGLPQVPGSGTRFSSMLRMRVPAWGGIILGNEPAAGGPTSIHLEILLLPGGIGESADDPERLPIVRVTFEDGSVADYADLTPTELWAAYNFVQPTEALAERLGELPELQGNDAGVVGITENRRDGTWDFAVHPAITDTYLARDAMRVDMSISTAAETPAAERGSLASSGFLTEVSWDEIEFSTYQWYDERARIWPEHGTLRVEAAQGPETCLMRVRLVNIPDLPEWAGAEAAFRREVIRRVERQAGARFGASVSETWIEQALERETRAMAGEIERAVENVTSDTSLDPHMGRLCESFEALRNIDRLARLVAVFNWYLGASGSGLPPLPEGLRPVFEDVPSTWSHAAVFPGAFDAEELAEIWQAEAGSGTEDSSDRDVAVAAYPGDEDSRPPGWDPTPIARWIFVVLLVGLVLGAGVVGFRRRRARTY